MKKVTKALTAASLVFTLGNPVSAEELTIKITGAMPNQGQVYLAIFDKADQFPGGKPLKLITARENSAKVHLQKGIYAVVAYQDENNNNKLDKNFIGLPKERVGASGKKSFGKPKFSNAAFKLDKNGVISINLGWKTV